MQRQKVILIPPSDEQAYPVFHVTRELGAAFLAHLAACLIEVRDPPERIGRLGPGLEEVIEVELMDDRRSIKELENTVNDFFATRNVSND